MANNFEKFAQVFRTGVRPGAGLPGGGKGVFAGTGSLIALGAAAASKWPSERLEVVLVICSSGRRNSAFDRRRFVAERAVSPLSARSKLIALERVDAVLVICCGWPGCVKRNSAFDRRRFVEERAVPLLPCQLDAEPGGAWARIPTFASLPPFPFSKGRALTPLDGGHRAVKYSRIFGVSREVYPEGTHLVMPWFETPIIFDVRARPRNVS
ncbi:MAG: hypothetical protein BJ554DRAFT_2485, partial [Olpidium bornovanus]